MTKYREIIRLTGMGFSQRDIMASCGVAQKTVVKVQKRARELKLAWPLDESLTDTELQKLMFAKETKVSPNKRMPDYAYIRKELLRNGVSKKLLWTEYMEDCRANGEEPLMYSQFCYHIQQDEQKHRATMHINRKPGEQVEVDWAGDSAIIVDPDTGEIIKAYIFVGVITYSMSRVKLNFLPTANLPQIKFDISYILSIVTCCFLRHVFICLLDLPVLIIHNQYCHYKQKEKEQPRPKFVPSP